MDKLYSEISLACTHEIFGIRKLRMKSEKTRAGFLSAKNHWWQKSAIPQEDSVQKKRKHTFYFLTYASTSYYFCVIPQKNSSVNKCRWQVFRTTYTLTGTRNKLVPKQCDWLNWVGLQEAFLSHCMGITNWAEYWRKHEIMQTIHCYTADACGHCLCQIISSAAKTTCISWWIRLTIVITVAVITLLYLYLKILMIKTNLIN